VGDGREWTGFRHSSFVVYYVPVYQFDAHLTMSGRFLVHEKAEIYHPLFCGQITKAKASMKLSEDGSSGGSREVAWWAEQEKVL
jgi:hypothetical protein